MNRFLRLTDLLSTRPRGGFMLELGGRWAPTELKIMGVTSSIILKIKIYREMHPKFYPDGPQGPQAQSSHSFIFFS